jgi:hypothetical protein
MTRASSNSVCRDNDASTGTHAVQYCNITETIIRYDVNASQWYDT